MSIRDNALTSLSCTNHSTYIYISSFMHLVMWRLRQLNYTEQDFYRLFLDISVEGVTLFIFLASFRKHLRGILHCICLYVVSIPECLSVYSYYRLSICKVNFLHFVAFFKKLLCLTILPGRMLSSFFEYTSI